MEPLVHDLALKLVISWTIRAPSPSGSVPFDSPTPLSQTDRPRPPRLASVIKTCTRLS